MKCHEKTCEKNTTIYLTIGDIKMKKLSDPDTQRQRFLVLLNERPSGMTHKLEALKAERVQLERPDFVWHFLLQSFATMGNSRGYHGLIANPENYRRVRFEVVAPLARDQRRQHLAAVLLAAKVRMPKPKAQWLDRNCERILAMGGLEATRAKALAQAGTEAKMAFMRQFAGIGPKYARNIWMDVYHPDFYDRIAIDDRIKKVTAAMGYAFTTYEAQEHFYLSIAREAGLQGWELDRLLYNFSDYFLRGLRSEPRIVAQDDPAPVHRSQTDETRSKAMNNTVFSPSDAHQHLDGAIPGSEPGKAEALQACQWAQGRNRGLPGEEQIVCYIREGRNVGFVRRRFAYKRDGSLKQNMPNFLVIRSMSDGLRMRNLEISVHLGPGGHGPLNRYLVQRYNDNPSRWTIRHSQEHHLGAENWRKLLELAYERKEIK